MNTNCIMMHKPNTHFISSSSHGFLPIRNACSLVYALICFFFIQLGSASADDLYMGPDEAIKTLRDAFEVMERGDTLIIRNGTYRGEENQLVDGQMPPSGIADTNTFTIIRAENNGRVTFDGEGERFMFFVTQGEHSYIHFEGLKWINPDSSDYDDSAGAVELSSTGIDHFKFIRCGAMVPSGFSQERMVWNIRSGSYYLLEECYVWGAGRYGFMIQDISNGNGAKKVVLRRCVVRMDDVNGFDDPTGGIFIYEGTEVEVQNCIVLDIDTSRWSNWTYSTAAFGARRKDHSGDHSYDIHFRGCIALNILGWTHGSSDNAAYMAAFGAASDYNAERPNSFENCIGWGVMWGSYHTSTSIGTPTFNNCTIKTVNDPNGDGSSTGARGLRLGDAWTAKNNIVINHQDFAMRGGFASNYNAVFSSGVDFHTDFDGDYDYCDNNNNEIDPMEGLDYIVRIKEGSALDGTGENEANRGATVLKRYGVSGSFWGDPGYNTLTDEDLWPFPYEDQIKADMSQYNPVNGPSGTRGFCSTDKQLNGVDDITLTSYIWEYLENPCPEGICQNSGNSQGVIVNPTSGLSVDEDGATAAFTVVLRSAPIAEVTMAISSSDSEEGTVSPDSITFNTDNWNTAQTATVTGVDDDVSDGDQAFTILINPCQSNDNDYDGLDPTDVSVTNADNESGSGSGSGGSGSGGGGCFIEIMD